ncbi:MAG: helix-turn-helix transcriptional regulator [Vicinamibacterales bacterium]|nr:helix-turn-helix transcriptional regulator [Vicinamibacterales bacterium]
MLDAAQIESLRDVPIDQDSPNRVAAAIKLLGVTQRAVATELGMTDAQMSDLCRGRYRAIRLETARRLAAYFGCSIEDLFPSREGAVA